MLRVLIAAFALSLAVPAALATDITQDNLCHYIATRQQLIAFNSVITKEQNPVKRADLQKENEDKIRALASSFRDLFSPRSGAIDLSTPIQDYRGRVTEFKPWGMGTKMIVLLDCNADIILYFVTPGPGVIINPWDTLLAAFKATLSTINAGDTVAVSGDLWLGSSDVQFQNQNVGLIFLNVKASAIRKL